MFEERESRDGRRFRLLTKPTRMLGKKGRRWSTPNRGSESWRGWNKEETGRYNVDERERKKLKRKRDGRGKRRCEDWNAGVKEGKGKEKKCKKSERERMKRGKEAEAETYIFRGANETAQCGGTVLVWSRNEVQRSQPAEGEGSEGSSAE